MTALGPHKNIKVKKSDNLKSIHIVSPILVFMDAQTDSVKFCINILLYSTLVVKI